MCYTVAITPEDQERIYWTMVPIDFIAKVAPVGSQLAIYSQFAQARAFVMQVLVL
jgi:hypothetical protein